MPCLTANNGIRYYLTDEAMQDKDFIKRLMESGTLHKTESSERSGQNMSGPQHCGSIHLKKTEEG